MRLRRAGGRRAEPAVATDDQGVDRTGIASRAQMRFVHQDQLRFCVLQYMADLLPPVPRVDRHVHDTRPMMAEQRGNHIDVGVRKNGDPVPTTDAPLIEQRGVGLGPPSEGAVRDRVMGAFDERSVLQLGERRPPGVERLAHRLQTPASANA